MKTTKLVIGIFSMVFFFFIVLQSCATGVANAFSGNSDDSSGIAGIFMETHPNPKEALSDGPNAWPLKKIKALLEVLAEIDRSVKKAGFIEMS